MKTKIIINGRFYSQAVTGVQRFARETVLALESSFEIWNKQYEFVIALPSDAKNVPVFKNISVKKNSRFKGQFWEQIILPRLACGALLINLCNSAPFFLQRQITVIHDMAIFSIPEAYSLNYKLWYKVMYFFLKKYSSQIATVSNFSKHEIHNYLQIPLSDIPVLIEGRDHILRLDSDNQILSKHSLEKRPYVLAVSSMTPNKNFNIVVKAIEMMKDCAVDFVIAGGTNPAVFSSNSQGLPDSVKHVGYVSDNELKALYEAAYCFVFPSFYEGFGLPPMEAMTCGCPVVASNRASIPEVCGDAAIYFEPTDATDVKQKLLMLFNDNNLRCSLSIAGLKNVERYTWKTTASQLVSLIKKGLS